MPSKPTKLKELIVYQMLQRDLEKGWYSMWASSETMIALPESIRNLLFITGIKYNPSIASRTLHYLQLYGINISSLMCVG